MIGALVLLANTVGTVLLATHYVRCKWRPQAEPLDCAEKIGGRRG